MSSNYIVVFDFDGTITETDVAEQILEHHAHQGWKLIDLKLQNGEITLEECMRQEYAMIEGEYQDIVNTGKSVPLRVGFSEIIKFIDSNSLDKICISAGMSFIIKEIFNEHNIVMDLVVPSLTYNHDTKKLDFKMLEFNRAKYKDFKESEVSKLKSDGSKVIYYGDGSSDRNGMVMADLRFAIKGSTMDRLCKEEGIEYTSFDNFEETIQVIKNFIGKK